MHPIALQYPLLQRLPGTTINRDEPRYSISCKLVCEPSEDSDQPSQSTLPSIHSIIIREATILISLEAGLSFREAHIQSCRKCCVLAQMITLNRGTRKAVFGPHSWISMWYLPKIISTIAAFVFLK